MSKEDNLLSEIVSILIKKYIPEDVKQEISKACIKYYESSVIGENEGTTKVDILIKQLTDLGINHSLRESFISTYSFNQLWQAIAVWNEFRHKNALKNPGGFFTNALKEGWEPNMMKKKSTKTEVKDLDPSEDDNFSKDSQ